MIKRKRQEYIDTCLIYENLLENPTKNMNDSEMKIYKQISVDVPRTMPEHKLFSYEIIRKMMLRVLYVWSMRHPASGYVQGFNDLCTPFFVIFLTQHLNNVDIEATLEINEDIIYDLGQETLFEIEADTYWCFTKMMDRIQNNYTHNQPGLTLMIQKMEEIIKLVDEDLFKHLIQFDITFMQFSFRWMNCYLMREFSLKLIIRIWDTYFSEEDAFNNFHLYVCAGLLLNFSEKIKKMTEFQETMMFLQNLPMTNWSLEEIDVLLAKAYQIHTMYSKMVEKKLVGSQTQISQISK
jgi:TBC1 domain family member 2